MQSAQFWISNSPSVRWIFGTGIKHEKIEANGTVQRPLTHVTSHPHSLWLKSSVDRVWQPGSCLRFEGRSFLLTSHLCSLPLSHLSSQARHSQTLLFTVWYFWAWRWQTLGVWAVPPACRKLVFTLLWFLSACLLKLLECTGWPVCQVT